MTDNEARALLRILTPFIDKRIKQRTTDLGVVYRLPATVTEAENAVHYATVEFPALDNSPGQKLYLRNCSGADLDVGDNVWVEYMYSLDNAYIAIKNDGRPWGWKA